MSLEIDRPQLEGARFGSAIDAFSTGGDKDWFETLVYLDLPPSIAPAAASVDVRVGGTSILPQPIALNVPDAAPNARHPFETFETGPLTTNQFRVMERADHYTLSPGADVHADDSRMSMSTPSVTSNSAKTFFRSSRGRLCARRAPTGAASTLLAATAPTAGQYT